MMHRAGLAWVALVALLTGCAAEEADGDGKPSWPDPVDASHVDMSRYQFVPKVIRVPVGTNVTWMNLDVAPHTVTPFDREAWGSGGSGDAREAWLPKNGTYERTLAAPGTYDYYCLPHTSRGRDGGPQGMMGRVIVVPA